MTHTAPPTTATVGELRASGHAQKHLRDELRDNLLAKLRTGDDPWPGLHGFEGTVIPQLERALIAGHDVVLLGERGQGKTRLLRALIGLLERLTSEEIRATGQALLERPAEDFVQSLAEVEQVIADVRAGTAGR